MIYVDSLKWYNGKQWCHMITDGNIQELHDFATKIEMKREWFQDHPRHPHYDLQPNKRALAISCGAKSVTGKELVMIMRGE